MLNKPLKLLMKLAITLVLILGIVGVLVTVKVLQIQALIAAGQNMTMPPDSVTTALVESQDWQPIVASVGTITAVQGVVVTSEVPGKVIAIRFDSGAEVEEGDLLLELDASTEQAQLRAAEAASVLATINLERNRELFGKSAIAKSELDAAEARASETDAQVESLKAVLAKKTIVAPFTGRLGIREVNVGQFLGSGQAVVSLQSVDPVYVDFHIPQQKMSRVNVNHNLMVHSDDSKIGTLPGKVTAVASEVDRASRNLWIRGTLANPDGILRPGMFVQVEVIEPEVRSVVAIPATAVIYAPYGNSVYIVNEEEGKLVAQQRIVRLGETRGDFVEVTDGLSGGETLVTTGAFKLRNGSIVAPNNDKGLEFSLTPTPPNA